MKWKQIAKELQGLLVELENALGSKLNKDVEQDLNEVYKVYIDKLNKDELRRQRKLARILNTVRSTSG
jgi:CRISPR/Cas system CSM-associated protein Csm2 small subunit